VNVKASQGNMERMLGYTSGRRDVPVIVNGGQVSIGFGGS
jgi:hypothetical protein